MGPNLPPVLYEIVHKSQNASIQIQAGGERAEQAQLCAHKKEGGQLKVDDLLRLIHYLEGEVSKT